MIGVYLAYPIDQAGGLLGWNIDEAASWCLGTGFSWVYDPGSAFSVGPRATPTPAIREVNNEALAQASAVVAFLPKGVPSVGVPMEIDQAVRAGKTVLVISDAPSWSLQYVESNVLVVSSWGRQARKYLSEALRGASEGLAVPSRARLPVVVEEGAEEPRRGYADDAGLDLVVSEPRVVNPGEFVDIPCGVRAQLPDWSWGLITGRSSTLRKRGLMVNQGVIDAGYRGPLFAGVWNLTDEPVKVERGERIAQLLILHNGTRLVEVEQVDRLDVGTRGENGFGSTGI